MHCVVRRFTTSQTILNFPLHVLKLFSIFYSLSSVVLVLELQYKLCPIILCSVNNCNFSALNKTLIYTTHNYLKYTVFRFENVEKTLFRYFVEYGSFLRTEK